MGFSVVGYDVGEMLGFGTFGEVWSARGRASGRLVALRRIRVSRDIGRRAQPQAAAAMLAAVEHPHLVRVHGVVTTGDSVVLVLDHVGGGSLSRLLERRGRLSPGEVVTVLVPLAQALAVAHDQGVVHGRVTPSAVLLGDDGRPLLSDLGLAAMVGLPDGSVPGPGAAADGRVVAGPAEDVRDLAATCWTALVGRPPYDDAGARVRHGPLGAAGERVAAVLEAALSPDPERRPSADVLADQVFAAAAAVPLRSDPLRSDPLLSDPLPSDPLVRTVSRPGTAAARHDSPGTLLAADPGTRAGGPRSGDPRSGGRRGGGPRAGGSHRASTGAARRARWRGWAAALLGAAALAMAALSGLAWAGADAGAPAAGVTDERPRRPVATQGGVPPGPGSGPSRSAAPASAPHGTATATARGSRSSHPWNAVLARLDALRADAFARASVARLAAVYADTSPAFARDRSLLADLVAAGMQARGLHLRATRVRVHSQRPSRVVLLVADVLAPYEIRDLHGTLVERRSGRGTRTWTVTLAREGGDWRVYDVVAS